jgi:hypothetical protein
VSGAAQRSPAEGEQALAETAAAIRQVVRL